MEAEGHGQSKTGLHPRASMDGRRRRVRSQAPRLLAEDQQENEAAGDRLRALGKVKADEFIIVDEIALEQIKTKAVAGMLDKFGISGKTLIVTGERDEKVYLSGRNIPGVNVTEAAGVNVYDLVASGKCVITEAAVRKIEQMQEAE